MRALLGHSPFRAGSFSLLFALLVANGSAQTCNNFGIASSGTCECPPGLGGSSCSDLACGNPIQSQSQRQAFSLPVAGNNGASGCAAQCSDGFKGPDCNVCTTNNACQAAISANGSVSSTSGSTFVNPEAANLSGAICSTSSYVWTQGFLTCDVDNPTLEGVFPGSTTITISKTAEPQYSLSSPFGTNGTATAQIWYSPSTGNTTVVEQFSCSATSCTQTNTTNNYVDWVCSDLQCQCQPGTQFCGTGAIDLTTTINGLTGPLSIECEAVGTGCSFKQSILQTLFGPSGLSLTGCSFGECVLPATIDTLAAKASGSNGSSGSSLSRGVIAGLAVLGAVLLSVLAFIAWGCAAQRKARRQPVSLDHQSEVGMRWTNVGYSLPKRNAIGRKSKVDDGRVLLDGVTGYVQGGHMCSILGPSGAGKSTLVDILAGKRKVGRTTGQVELLVPESERHSKVTVGYVDQSDVLPATSTVREALRFAADLKLGEAVTRAQKEERVFEVLRQLGLVDIADSRIGSGERRGISGGERRRLSIGLELIAAPAILIADEPTSGLDSVSAMRVIQVLKSLTTTSSGLRTTVITTIHQPSSQIFHMFDSVLVLALGGRPVYFGNAKDANAHFASLGYPCPEGWNPADHLLELASAPPAKILSPASLGTRSSASSSEDEKLPISKESIGSTVRRQSKPKTTTLTQFEVLAGRELKNLKRDWSLVIMHNAVAAIVGLFVGGLYYRVNTSIGGFQSRVGALFFLGSLIAFSALSALANFTHIKPLFLRERSSAYYSPFAWFLSRVVFDIVPLRIFPTLIVSCIVYWMVGLAPTAANFFKYLLILLEFNIAITLWNLLLAASINESSISILISAVLNLFQMAFAGFFVNLASIPAVLRWLQYLSPLKYALEALSVNEVGSGLLINDTLAGVKVSISAVIIMETLFGFKTNAYYRDVLVLFAFIGGFAALVVLTVIYRLREVR